MRYYFEPWCEAVFNNWQALVPMSVPGWMLGVVVLGWYLTRFATK